MASGIAGWYRVDSLHLRTERLEGWLFLYQEGPVAGGVSFQEVARQDVKTDFHWRYGWPLPQFGPSGFLHLLHRQRTHDSPASLRQQLFRSGLRHLDRLLVHRAQSDGRRPGRRTAV